MICRYLILKESRISVWRNYVIDLDIDLIQLPEERFRIFIIQQIVTLSKYGHDVLDICHP